jgi:signal transduction histidine kinase
MNPPVATRPGAAHILDSPAWEPALDQFARASGVAVAIMNAAGAPHIGPFTPTPLTEMLRAAMEPEGAAYPRDLVRRVLTGETPDRVVQGHVLDVLAVVAIPLRSGPATVGVVLAGWVFDQSPDPVSTDRLARRLGVAYPTLWQHAHSQAPVSRETLAVYAGLLESLTDAVARERTETLREMEHARQLAALNQSAQRLATADSVDGIATVVEQTARELAHVADARLTVGPTPADDDPATPDVRHSTPRPSELQTSGVRIPVATADGVTLGCLELPGAHEAESVLDALAAQTATALQKVQLFQDVACKQQSLEVTNRAKNEFLSVLSHELRTPLTPILGWAAMLRRGVEQGDREVVSTAVEAIERNARQELHLVDEMLDLSRLLNHKVHLELERVHPADALATALAQAQASLRSRDLAMRIETAQHLPWVLADPRRLQQILGNLVSNAIKFTEDGGVLTLGASAAGTAVQFSVSDTGVGIDAADVPTIFDPFRQADSSTTRRHGGLGIGLSVVRGLVELHGGQVWAESDGPGRGATFVVRLPAAVGHPVRPLPALPPEARPTAPFLADPRETPRVLVVDDAEDSLAMLHYMLQSEGFDVETAGSVTEALDKAEAFRPHSIVSDIGMPDADGYELVSRVHASPRLASVPVIALTGYASAADRELAVAAGFASHVTKPVEPTVLLDAIRTVMAR